MSRNHYAVWPDGQPRDLTAPATNLFYNAVVSAERYPDKPFAIFYGSVLTFRDLKHDR